MSNILRNSITTPDGTILKSEHRYDFNQYKDNNGQTYAVDGGLDYLRRVCPTQDYIETSLFTTDSIEKLREELVWGTYGKNGDEPLHYIKYKDLSDEHLNNIISTQGSNKFIRVLSRELKYRQQYFASVLVDRPER